MFTDNDPGNVEHHEGDHVRAFRRSGDNDTANTSSARRSKSAPL